MFNILINWFDSYLMYVRSQLAKNALESLNKIHCYH